MEQVCSRWLMMGVLSVSVVIALVFSTSIVAAEGAAENAAEGATESGFRQLDAEVEQVLNDVVALGAEIAILEESREMSQQNQLQVLVSMDPSPFFKLEAIQLNIDDRTASYYQYRDVDLEAMSKGGSHRLFWDDVPAGRHQLSVLLFGRVPRDPDFQREATHMVITGTGRRVVELRVVSGKNQAFPEMLIQEWK